MKTIIMLLLSAAVASAGTAQTKATAFAKFNVQVIDVGKIQQGKPATATFEVTNISNKALVIEQATPGCGCTVADYSKAPIAPGKTGFIKATYNAASIGAFEKTITVKFTGVNETQAITLTGEVLAPNKE